jgi:sulfatase-like protein
LTSLLEAEMARIARALILISVSSSIFFACGNEAAETSASAPKAASSAEANSGETPSSGAKSATPSGAESSSRVGASGEVSTANLIVVTIAGLTRDSIGTATPRLNAFRQESTNFEMAITPLPTLAAATAGLWRGRYPVASRSGAGAEVAAATAKAGVLTDRLREAGRTTAAVTCFPADFIVRKPREFVWLRQGFDLFINDPSPDNDAKRVIDRGVELMSRGKDGAFALWLTLPDLAAPLLPVGEKAARRHEMQAERLRRVDREFGRLLDDLDRLGLREGTLVVVHSDRGRSVGDADALSRRSAVDMRELRVPLWMRIPGCPPAQVQQPVSLVDVAPTVAALMGVEAPRDTQGRAVLSADGRLRGDGGEDVAALVQLRDPTRPEGNADVIITGERAPAAVVIDHASSSVVLRPFVGEALSERGELMGSTLDDSASLSKELGHKLEVVGRLLNQVRPFFVGPYGAAQITEFLRRDPREMLVVGDRAERRRAFRSLLHGAGNDDAAVNRYLAPLLKGEGFTEGAFRAQIEQRKIDALRFGMWSGRLDEDLLAAALRESRGDYGPRQTVALLALALSDAPSAQARLVEASQESSGQLPVAALLARGLRGEAEVAPRISGLLAEGSYRDRLIAAGAMAGATRSAGIPIVESLLVSRSAPEDVEALLWRGYIEAASPLSLAMAYVATMPDEGTLPRSRWALELAGRAAGDQREARWPLLRALAFSDQAAAELGSELELARRIQALVADARDAAREGARLDEVAPWLRRAWRESLAAGHADWGLLFEVARIAYDTRRFAQGRELLGAFRSAAEKKGGLAAALATPLAERLDGLLAGSETPARVSLSLNAAPPRYRLQSSEAVFSVTVKVESGGALFGGFSLRAPTLAGALRQAEQSEIMPSGVRMPPLGLMPGEAATLLVVVPLENLKPGGAIALLSLVRDGVPLDVLRHPCEIAE